MASPDPREIHGRLVSLTQVTQGSALDLAASTGSTILSLYDASDFDEDGGSVQVNGVVYAYSSADMDSDTIHLTTGLTSAAAVDDRVDIWDADELLVVTERIALVTLDDQQEGDPLSVEVDHSLHAMLARETLAAGQSVSLLPDGESYRLVAVHGKNNQNTLKSNAATALGSQACVQMGLDQGDGTVIGVEAEYGGSAVRIVSNTDVRVKSPDRSAYHPVLASAFTVSSDPAVKTRPTAPPDALEIIRQAPAAHWRYLTDDADVKRLGPMADRLPEWLAQRDEEDGLMLDLARQNGVLWRAVEQLLDRIERLEGR
jgi:hypothetical protein